MTYGTTRFVAEQKAAEFNSVSGSEVTRFVVCEIHSPFPPNKWGVVRQIRFQGKAWQNDGWVDLGKH